MDANVLVSIITGIFTIAGVIITCITSNRKVETKLEISQAVTETKIDNLAEEVRKHNDFAVKIPVMQEQIKVANHRIEDLEKHIS